MHVWGLRNQVRIESCIGDILRVVPYTKQFSYRELPLIAATSESVKQPKSTAELGMCRQIRMVVRRLDIGQVSNPIKTPTYGECNWPIHPLLGLLNGINQTTPSARIP